MHEALEVAFLGPREWGPLWRIPGLWKVELLLWVRYLLRFIPLDIRLQAGGLERPFGDFRFGETPWFTGHAILVQAEVGPHDRLVDLGSGRGKLVFMASLACHCEAVGVELLPSYVRISRYIAARTGCRNVTFIHKDLLEVDLSQATVVFVCATAFSEETRESLLLLIERLNAGTRWICVSWAPPSPRLELLWQKEYLFSWGREMVYGYRVAPDGDSSWA